METKIEVILKDLSKFKIQSPTFIAQLATVSRILFSLLLKTFTNFEEVLERNQVLPIKSHRSKGDRVPLSVWVQFTHVALLHVILNNDFTVLNTW